MCGVQRAGPGPGTPGPAPPALAAEQLSCWSGRLGFSLNIILYSPIFWFTKYYRYGIPIPDLCVGPYVQSRGSQSDVVLSWLTNSASLYEAKCAGRGG